MRLSERQLIANRVVQFYTEISSRDRRKTVAHFEAEGLKRRTLNRIIQRYESTGTSTFRPKPGRTPRLVDKNKFKKVQKLLENRDNSLRDVAKAVGLKLNRVFYVKKKLGIKSGICQRVPKYTGDQEIRAKRNCRKIYRQSINRVLVIDDETYVKADPRANYGRKHFHYINKNEVPNQIRYQSVEKYPKKYLIWQALDEFGNTSDPYITDKPMNSKTYLNECLKKRLLPFIQKHHRLDQILFWPDMAPIHYGKIVINGLLLLDFNT